MSSINVSGNVIAQLLEVVTDLQNEENQSILVSANLAQTLAYHLQDLASKEEQTINAAMNGSLNGKTFDNHTINCPGFDGNSDDDEETSAFINMVQSGAQALIQNGTTGSTESTQLMKSLKSAITQLMQFPGSALNYMSFVEQLASNSYN